MKNVERKLKHWIQEGRGYGHGENYKPWIKITRGLRLRGSNLNRAYLYTIGRQGHFLSRNERRVALFLMWLFGTRIHDLREQYPLWPFPHPHPLQGVVGLEDERFPISRGTQEIARDLGIKHGEYVGTNIPYIYTSDIELSVNLRGFKGIGVAVKPRALLMGEKVSQRDIEILALQKAVHTELGMGWLLLSGAIVSNELYSRLELCYPASLLSESWASRALVEDGCSNMNQLLHAGVPVNRSINEIATKMRIDDRLALGLFYHGLWHRYIEVDLRSPLLMTMPAVMTDNQWCDAELNNLMEAKND